MVYKFILSGDLIYDIKKYYAGVDVFFYKKNKIVGHIKNGILTIFKGFAWDGCTPKIRIFGEIIGVPDFKETYIASAVHDFLIKYSDQHQLSREDIDNIFEYILTQEKFALTFIYANSVHLYRKYKYIYESIHIQGKG